MPPACKQSAEGPSDHELISAEENRLTNILQTTKDYECGRRDQLQKYHDKISTLKKERLDAVSWQEKNKLTAKLRDKEAYNPQKYLPPFSQNHSPYFASFSIKDDSRSIGKQQYLLGKQSLFKDNKVVIIDWRQAAISALYYEYEINDEYEEEINGRERSGVLTAKTKYTIKTGELLSFELADDTIFEKRQGSWQKNGKTKATSQVKEDAADHHLVDIVSLISPDQFRLITREYHGCLRLQGSAGAGKTTIALHRLSFLQFNYPEKFRPERCLVLMFNRALRNYVASTVTETLAPQTPVETFHSWAARSFRALGLKKISFSAAVPAEFDQIKKASGMAGLIEGYAKNAQDATAAIHLTKMFSSRELAAKYLSREIKAPLLEKFTDYYSEQLNKESQTSLGFADAGILLRLLQIRLCKHDPAATNLALNYFDHMVIDEAQDFSQVELECLFHATNSERSLTICADPNQQILNFVDAKGLENFQINLRKSGVNAEKLEISYRSTLEIMEVANAVLGQGAGHGNRRGEPVLFGKYESRDEAMTELERIVLANQEQSPNGLIAVICKHKGQVNKIYEKLRTIPGIRKDPQKFQPGILIINGHQVKGLEFTSVIIWNATAKSYRRDNDHDRNLLYVSLSRACDRLAVLCHEKPTEFLEKFF